MTSAQFRQALSALGLSQVEAAKFLGVSIRTAHGWANGAPIPDAVSKLLQVMVDHRIAPADLRAPAAPP